MFDIHFDIQEELEKMLKEEFEHFKDVMETLDEEGILLYDDVEDYKTSYKKLFEGENRDKSKEEHGLWIKDEIQLSKDTSVIIDRRIKVETEENALNGYQKVVEMRELLENEKNNIENILNSIDNFLKTLFPNIGSSFLFGLFIIYGFGQVKSDNYLLGFLLFLGSLLPLNLKGTLKLIKKRLQKEKMKQKLEEELSKLGLLSLVYDASNNNKFGLYLKPEDKKGNNFTS